jgi:hypothetical protein
MLPISIHLYCQGMSIVEHNIVIAMHALKNDFPKPLFLRYYNSNERYE